MLNRFLPIVLCVEAAVGIATRLDAGEINGYPIGPLNPRVPVIPAVADQEVHWALPFEAEFTYSIEPYVTFAKGGELTVRLRDNLRRGEKQLLTLADGDTALQFVVSSAAAGRRLDCVLKRKSDELSRTPLTRPESGWTTVKLQWSGDQLKIEQDDKPAGSMILAAPFSPKKLQLQTWSVAGLALSGDGIFNLDWSHGYAAQIDAANNGKGMQGSALGFDTFVVSQDPTHRDCPTLQLINFGSTDQPVAVSFELESELSASKQQWQQTFTVPAKSDLSAAIRFPAALSTDVYHLTLNAPGLFDKTRKNFIFVQRRSEKAGPPKFGLHDSGVKRMGTWPDALPIDVGHVYASWGYIQGPPWIKDWDGKPGIDPALSSDQWNWQPRVDSLILEGRLPYVCLVSMPFLDWQRSQAYSDDAMVKLPWGPRGGAPDYAKYATFVRTFAERYKGKIWAYEVENEPNTPQGFKPQDYAQIAKAVSTAVRSVDPKPRIFGVCGTSTFVTWMQKAFAAGAADFLDGVSFHTYVTPALPDEVNLWGLLTDVRHAIEETKPGLALINSETGTYVAPREKIDEPIAEDRLDALVTKGQSPLAIAKGWPSRAMSERRGSISVVTNAITNFTAGAECFVFFGWNPDWPPEPKWWNTTFDYTSFGMFSCDINGERTPSRFTLAAAVMTAQMEPVQNAHGQRISDGTLRGGLFHKTNGGSLAALWSTIGQQSVLLRSASPRVDVVSLFGQTRQSQGVARDDGKFVHTVSISDEPTYIHDDAGMLEVLPSPLKVLACAPQSPLAQQITLEVNNPFTSEWKGTVTADPDARWQVAAGQNFFDLKSGERAQLTFNVTLPQPLKGGRYRLALGTQTPADQSLTASAELNIRPTFALASVAPATTARDLAKWSMPGGALQLNRDEQVVAGRAPPMASLQDSQYWMGSDELSSSAKLATNGTSLLAYIEVNDAHARLPKDWPGVAGSCIELFFDFRSPQQGQGSSPYAAGVSQIVVRPVLQAGQEPAVWRAAGGPQALPNLHAESGPIDAHHYWIALTVPLSDARLTMNAGTSFGFDLAIDGAKDGPTGRKSQLMLFGTANNNRDASRFGLGFVSPSETAPKP